MFSLGMVQSERKGGAEECSAFVKQERAVARASSSWWLHSDSSFVNKDPKWNWHSNYTIAHSQRSWMLPWCIWKRCFLLHDSHIQNMESLVGVIWPSWEQGPDMVTVMICIHSEFFCLQVKGRVATKTGLIFLTWGKGSQSLTMVRCLKGEHCCQYRPISYSPPGYRITTAD